jgi:hypothetical protein
MRRQEAQSTRKTSLGSLDPIEKAVVAKFRADLSDHKAVVAELGADLSDHIADLTKHITWGIPLPYGARLWHFDGSLVSTDGTAPESGAVATLRPDGRFGGAVAVEVATTNLWANENGRAMNMSAGGSTPPTVELVNMQTPWGSQVWKVTIPANNDTGYSGCRANTNSGPINLDGRPYSYYTYVMGDIDGIYIYPTGSAGMANLSPKPNWDVGEWRCYKKENYTSSAGIVGSNFLCFYAEQTKSYDRTFYVAIIQLEGLPFSTSFVNGTRAVGELEYEVTYGERGTLAWRMTGSSATTATDVFTLGTGNTITQLSGAGSKLSWSGLDCSLDISPLDWLYCVATWDRVSGDRSLTVHNLTQGVNASATATDADTLAFGSTLSYGGANLADVRYDEVMYDPLHAATPEQIAAWHNMGVPFWDPWVGQR